MQSITYSIEALLNFVTDHIAFKRHDPNGKVSKVAEQDFLSGISLGATQTRNSIDRGSRDGIRTSISQAPLRESFTSRAESTPSKSIPITPRSSAIPRVSNSFQSSSLSEDFSGAAHHEEEVGNHEATNLLFGVPEDSNVPGPMPSTIVSGKTFNTAPRKLMRHIADGKRVIFGFSGHSHHHHSPHHSAKHVHPIHPSQSTSGAHQAPHESRKAYSAVTISSILVSERAAPVDTAPTATLNVITHNPTMAGIRGDAPSDISDDDKADLSRASHGRSARHIYRLLNFKRKGASSVSYAAHLKPSSDSIEMNSQIRARLPPFRVPREAIITSADMILRSAGDDSPQTPSKSKTSKRNLVNHADPSPSRTSHSHEAPLDHLHSSDDSEPTPSSDSQAEVRAEVTLAINNFVGEIESLAASMEVRSEVATETATSLPNSSLSQAIALDPYERCLIHYDPDFLDYDVEAPGKFLFKSRLPGYTSSVMTLKPAKSMRSEQNEAFRNRHSWLTTDLKLSKIRSVKRKMEHATISASLDIACTAFAYVYFEKLVLKNFVTNSTAKTMGAACLLLAAKFYGLKVPSFQPLVKELSQKMKIAPNLIVAHEFYVFRKLKFSLFVDDHEVNPHFYRLLNSPLILDKEFQVGQKERKKALKKQSATTPSNSLPTHT